MRHDVIAYHEAGHAVAFLSRGIAVAEIIVGALGGGACRTVRHLEEIPPHLLTLPLLAGVAAEGLLGEYHTDNDSVDLQLLREFGCLPSRELAAARIAADSFVWRHEQQIRGLAAQLALTPHMHLAEIGEFVHRRGSPLSEYADLYPRPVASQTSPAAGTDRVYHPEDGCSYVSDCGPAPEPPQVPGLRWRRGGYWTAPAPAKSSRMSRATIMTVTI